MPFRSSLLGFSCTAMQGPAVSQLPSTGAEIAEPLFHQEKATLENAEKCTGIVKPL